MATIETSEKLNDPGLPLPVLSSYFKFSAFCLSLDFDYLQLWNTNEKEDLQVMVVISRPPVKV